MRSLRLGSRPFVAVAAAAALLGGAAISLLGVCGPFTDISDAGFCPFVLEIFTLGITTGTSPTTYSPTDNVTRLQMAAFLSRTVDGALRRGSRRASLDQFWTPQNAQALGVTTVGDSPALAASDGADIWVANVNGSTVSRVRGSDGKLLETWTGAGSAWGVLSAAGHIFVTGKAFPGKLYRIDPTQPAGAVTTVASNLGALSDGITFDGSRIWTANDLGGVSIVTPAASLPWSATTVTAGFSEPIGILYDSASIWVTDQGAGTLLKLNGSAAVLQTVTVGALPQYPVFDGTNIWVPNISSDNVSSCAPRRAPFWRP